MHYLDILELYYVLNDVKYIDILDKIPNNLNKLRNVQCIKVVGFKNTGDYSYYASEIKRILPDKTVLLIDGDFRVEL